jgi:predicted nucleic acid-binding protein
VTTSLPESGFMKDRAFVDTNVLIYAHDADAVPFQRLAATLLEDLWEKESGILSTQVVEEFYVRVTRKISTPLKPAEARGIIVNYFAWQVEPITPSTILLASEIERRHPLSYWEALIVATASQAGAEKILSDVLPHGKLIEGIYIKNPFR